MALSLIKAIREIDGIQVWVITCRHNGINYIYSAVYANKPSDQLMYNLSHPVEKFPDNFSSEQVMLDFNFYYDFPDRVWRLGPRTRKEQKHWRLVR